MMKRRYDTRACICSCHLPPPHAPQPPSICRHGGPGQCWSTSVAKIWLRIWNRRRFIIDTIFLIYFQNTSPLDSSTMNSANLPPSSSLLQPGKTFTMGTNSEEMNKELDEDRGIVTKVLEQIFDSNRRLKAGPLVPIILNYQDKDLSSGYVRVLWPCQHHHRSDQPALPRQWGHHIRAWYPPWDAKPQTKSCYQVCPSPSISIHTYESLSPPRPSTPPYPPLLRRWRRPWASTLRGRPDTTLF